MNIAWEWDNDDEFFGEKLPPDTLDRKNMPNIFTKYVQLEVIPLT
ncbi:hypothetical protein STW0522ENT66_13410 [Enterobacter roggenkampii]|nr:hypothetical protein STW0522ENT66_13410 [Enterobacter roggenkampii]SAE88173.1 Uncharacterised protein [Enterobacter roggenkampii]